MNNQQRQSGFTLIETMISMLLGLIILGGTVTAYQAISGLGEQRDAVYQLQDELLYVHRTLAQAVTTADTVEVIDDKTLKITPFESAEGGGDAGCPQSGSEWTVVAGNGGDQKLMCNDQKVLRLEAPGITSVNFYDSSSESEGCIDAKNRYVCVTLKYTPCREKDECDVQTLSFNLASRATSDSDGGP
ncbi:type II secretion system protein J [Chromohalobacter sp. HP20-39]|uniref:PulJ/GspJ family protein n=1 Tax=Chromohalobacter sp. HP20-39 TaxID=3079306 RepID=UPI00294B2B0B|nr:prepilin-type N-terminal cleavage/methylation domain-containing protein [Chromohalobacter sp. HP20-39]MDV6320499.1 prepilin-type N-terminal cleavage/methylation domain-containing protein [Chromohalobacter sp. HP20-39]